MESSAPQIRTSTTHQFLSADGTEYHWEERTEASVTLEEQEIDDLRNHILSLNDSAIQNFVSGNGVPMGVQIPISQARLNAFLGLILTVIRLKDQLSVELTPHAAKRLAEDMAVGPGHPDFRGWLSEEDVENCVMTISQVDGARLTIDRKTLRDPQIKFNTSISLEVVGIRPDGTEGTLALAIIEAQKIRIITLL